jgi:hypothetical protein
VLCALVRIGQTANTGHGLLRRGTSPAQPRLDISCPR